MKFMKNSTGVAPYRLYRLIHHLLYRTLTGTSLMIILVLSLLRTWTRVGEVCESAWRTASISTCSDGKAKCGAERRTAGSESAGPARKSEVLRALALFLLSFSLSSGVNISPRRLPGSPFFGVGKSLREIPSPATLTLAMLQYGQCHVLG